MAIEHRFQVEYYASSKRWAVVAVGAGNVRVPIADGREELFADSLAARLNEAYADGIAEVTDLLNSCQIGGTGDGGTTSAS